MLAWQSNQSSGIDSLKLLRMPKPIPLDGQLLIKVHYAAINFSDLLMLKGQYQVQPELPFIPGQEVGGIVVQTSSTSRFNIGDRVASKVYWGGFGEYTCVNENMSMLLPQAVNLDLATTLPISYVTASVALHHCIKVNPEQTVLIHAAAGAVGFAAVEIALLAGCKVIATGSSSERLQRVKERGAHHCINYLDANWYQEVKNFTQNNGANVIFDPVGGEIGTNSLRCIAQDGTLLIVGFASGSMPKLAPHLLLLKRATAKGVYWNHNTDSEILNRVNSQIMNYIKAGALQPRFDIRHGIDKLPSALRDLEQRRVNGKLMLKLENT